MVLLLLVPAYAVVAASLQEFLSSTHRGPDIRRAIDWRNAMGLKITCANAAVNLPRAYSFNQ